MKRAVPVFDDNLEIFERTGQAPYLAIFEDNKLLKLRDNPKHSHSQGEHSDEHSHGDDEHHTNEHRNQVLAIKDCDEILVRRVGPNMKEALDEIGIKIVKIRKKHGDKADEVIRLYLNEGLK